MKHSQRERPYILAFNNATESANAVWHILPKRGTFTYLCGKRNEHTNTRFEVPYRPSREPVCAECERLYPPQP